KIQKIPERHASRIRPWPLRGVSPCEKVPAPSLFCAAARRPMARRARYSGLGEALEVPLATSRGFSRVNLSFTVVARQSLPGPVRLVRPKHQTIHPLAEGARSGHHFRKPATLTTQCGFCPIEITRQFALVCPNCARNKH